MARPGCTEWIDNDRTVLDYDNGMAKVQHGTRVLMRFFSAVAFLLLYILPTLAQTADPHTAVVAELLAPWSKPDGPGVQVAVFLDGKVIHHAKWAWQTSNNKYQ